eukprot:2864939-Pleurochrysis_carterae.AAC.1
MHKWKIFHLRLASPSFASTRCVRPVRFHNIRAATDTVEIFARVSIHSHKSFFPHGAVYMVSRDILEVGSVWAVDLSPLDRPVGLALYGRLNCHSVGSPEAVPLRSAPPTSGI